MVPTGELLVLQLHGHLLRLIASRSGSHFQGLSQAARCLRQSGQISPNLGKKLQQVDAAYNLIRHITSISVQAFSENIERELGRHVPRVHSMNTHGDYIDYDEDKAVSIKSVTTVTPVQDATDNLLNVIATTPTVQDDTTQSDTSGQDATDNLLNDFATTPTVHDDTTQSDYFTSVELHDDTPEMIINEVDNESPHIYSNDVIIHESFSHETANETSRHESSCTVHADTHYDETTSVVKSFLKEADRNLDRQEGVYHKYYYNGRHCDRDKPPKGDRGRRNSLRIHRRRALPSRLFTLSEHCP